MQIGPKQAAGMVVLLSGMLVAFWSANAQERHGVPQLPTVPTPAPRIDSAGHRIVFGDASLRIPKGWIVTRTLRNAVELAKPASEGGAVMLRSVLFQERRLNHEDAIRRLREMIASRADAATFFEVGGWPAFQRTYTGPLAESAREPAYHIGDSSAGPAEKPIATFIFTAIAAGDVVLQVETTAAPGAAQAEI
ncbi:MAG TPA: hypothetical protein VGF06_03505, partial [Terriglobales bacterium]